MNRIANNFRISDLPYYVKCSSSRDVLPRLDCHWSGEHCDYPFVLAITGNIATAETFPYDKKDYRRTNRGYCFPRRFMCNRGWHRFEYTFSILENIHTGEKVAILADVTTPTRTY